MATFWDFFLTLPLYNRIFGPFGHMVDIIHSKLDIKLEIVKFIFGCEALITVQLKSVDLYFMIFRQHAASIYGFVRFVSQSVKKKFKSLLSKVGG